MKKIRQKYDNLKQVMANVWERVLDFQDLQVPAKPRTARQNRHHGTWGYMGVCLVVGYVLLVCPDQLATEVTSQLIQKREDSECDDDEVKCGGDSDACVQHQFRCDGVDYGRCGWLGGGEELGCGDYVCKSDGAFAMVPCPGDSQLCVSHQLRCNGKDDKLCSGVIGGEEADCEDYECLTDLIFTMIQCPGGSQLCVEDKWRCNGKDDEWCNDVIGGEEAYCAFFHWKSDNGIQYTPRCGLEDTGAGGDGGGDDDAGTGGDGANFWWIQGEYFPKTLGKKLSLDISINLQLACTVDLNTCNLDGRDFASQHLPTPTLTCVCTDRVITVPKFVIYITDRANASRSQHALTGDGVGNSAKLSINITDLPAMYKPVVAHYRVSDGPRIVLKPNNTAHVHSLASLAEIDLVFCVHHLLEPYTVTINGRNKTSPTSCYTEVLPAASVQDVMFAYVEQGGCERKDVFTVGLRFIVTPVSSTSASDNSATGNSETGNTVPGNSVPGNSATGNSATGNSVPGNTVPGNTVPGSTDKPAASDKITSDGVSASSIATIVLVLVFVLLVATGAAYFLYNRKRQQQDREDAEQTDQPAETSVDGGDDDAVGYDDDLDDVDGDGIN